MHWVELAGLGVLVGFVAGMFGIGGGFLLTPLLHIVFGVPTPIAVGSSLCQQIGTSAGAFLKHRDNAFGEPLIDWIMVGGGLMGADAGARLLEHLEHRGVTLVNGRALPISTLVLDGIYGLLLVGAAAATLTAALRKGPEGPSWAPLARIQLGPSVTLPRAGHIRVSAIVLSFVGFATGLLSGLLGIGGGVALLPVLVYGYGLSIKDAAGTGIALLFVTVCFGTVVHAWRGNVDLAVAMAIACGSAFGVQLGARTTARLSNRALRLSFATLLLATAGAIATDVLRKVTG